MPGPRAHALKELVALLAALHPDRLRPHIERHDFSRWLAGVFRDHTLAAHVRDVESRATAEAIPDVAANIAQAIRARYDTRTSA